MLKNFAELFGFSQSRRAAEDHGLFSLLRAEDHALVLVRPEIETANTDQIEAAINRIGKLGDLPCIIDISQLSDLSSDVMTALVRVWKRIRERDGDMAVVTVNERSLAMLETAQLASIWNIADTHETAADQLGISDAARMEDRERRLLVIVAPWALLTAILIVVLEMVPGIETEVILPTIALVLCTLALICGGFSVIREHGFRRAASAVITAIALMLGVGIALQQWFPDQLQQISQLNPFASKTPPDASRADKVEEDADEAVAATGADAAPQLEDAAAVLEGFGTDSNSDPDDSMPVKPDETTASADLSTES